MATEVVTTVRFPSDPTVVHLAVNVDNEARPDAFGKKAALCHREAALSRGERVGSETATSITKVLTDPTSSSLGLATIPSSDFPSTGTICERCLEVHASERVMKALGDPPLSGTSSRSKVSKDGTVTNRKVTKHYKRI